MLLTNPPTIENFPKDSPLKKKDLDKLRKFVVDNLDLLLKLLGIIYLLAKTVKFG